MRATAARRTAAADVRRRPARRSRHRAVPQQPDRHRLEQDPYDGAALHICAWGEDELIGTVRVILPVEARPLPVEAAFGLTVDPPGRGSSRWDGWRELGLPFETLAPARPYWGEPRHPVRLNPAQGHPRWF